MLAAALSVVLLVGMPGRLPGTATLPDTVRLEQFGSYPFRYGISLVVDSARSLAFVGSGDGVLIVDVSDPQNPGVLSDDIRCQGPVKSLWLDADRLYVAAFFYTTRYKPDRDVEIWDTSDPASPVMLGAVDLPLQGPGVWARDTILLATAMHELYSYNVADPANPVLLDSAQCGYGPDMMHLFDTLLLAATTGEGIQVWNISDPADLRLVTYWGARGLHPGFALRGDTVYLAVGQGPPGPDCGLFVYDISDPLNGRLLGVFDTSESRAYRCAVRDTFCLVTHRSGEPLSVLSVADPAAIYALDSLRPGFGSNGVAWFGSHAYVSFGDRFSVLDMSNPAHPVEVGHLPTGRVGYGIAKQGDLLVSAGYQLGVLETSDYDDPELLSLYDLGSHALGGLEMEDSLAVVLSWLYPHGYLLSSFNLHDPHNPMLVASCTLMVRFIDFDIADTLGFVATDSALLVRNLLRPGMPVVGSAAAVMAPECVEVADTLCLVGENSRLLVFSVADPTRPAVIADTLVRSSDMQVADTLLYVVRGALWVYNIVDPAHPRLLSLSGSENAQSVSVQDTLLVTGGEDHIEVWSVADPAAPRRLGYCPVPDEVRDLLLEDGVVYTNQVRMYELFTVPQGISEGYSPGQLTGIELCPALVRGVLALRGGLPASLLDISGRKVVELVPGENDIRHIAPGVYFVRSAESDAHLTVRKVIVQR